MSHTGARSGTLLWMTAAHRFGRLSPSALAATPPGPRHAGTPAAARLHPCAHDKSTGGCRPHAAAAPPAHSHRFPSPCLVAARGDTPTHLCAAASPHRPCNFHPDAAASPPSHPVAASLPVHATCCLYVSHGARHALTTTCARARSVTPAPSAATPPPRLCISCHFSTPAAPRCPVTPARTSRTPASVLAQRAPLSCTCWGTLRVLRRRAATCDHRFSPPDDSSPPAVGGRGGWHVAATASASGTRNATV